MATPGWSQVRMKVQAQGISGNQRSAANDRAMRKRGGKGELEFGLGLSADDTGAGWRRGRPQAYQHLSISAYHLGPRA